jgi:hypothetical protein
MAIKTHPKRGAKGSLGKPRLHNARAEANASKTETRNKPDKQHNGARGSKTVKLNEIR